MKNDEYSHLAECGGEASYDRRGFLQRSMALGLAAAAANSMFGTTAEAAGPKKGGTLTMGLGGGNATDTLDSAVTSNGVALVYFGTLGETLVQISPTGEAVPALAETWESSPDGATWIFKVRKGVEFHNGKTMAPDDVVKTIQRHSDKNSKSGAYGILQQIADVKVDGSNVIISMKSPNADLPYLMSDWHLVIQPGGGMDKPDSGIFTGAYKLNSFEPGARIQMERFKNYWDPTVGHFDAVNILVINDSTARNSALQSGQVDMVNLVEPRIAGLLKQAPKVIVESSVGRAFNCFNMLCDTTPFDNYDLRMALKLAIDREQMLNKVLRGYGALGNDSPINASYPLFDDSIPQRAYDPDKAKFHYKKSGHDGSIQLSTSDIAFAGAVDAAQLFQQSAARAGITIEVKRQPSDGYWDQVWNKEPLSASEFSGRPTQDQMFSTLYTSSASWNDTQFRNPRLDTLISEARGELDTNRRKEMYSEATLILRDQGGVITPTFKSFIKAYRSDRVTGWQENPNMDMMNGKAAVLCWEA